MTRTKRKAVWLWPALILSAASVHGSEMVDLSNFPESDDPIIQSCYVQAVDAADEDSKLEALEKCREDAPAAKDQPLMLYLLGLLHADPKAESDYFERLTELYPASLYVDMSLVKKAEATRRYNECEGMTLCSIENAVVGWIDFLQRKPRSQFAEPATDNIVTALQSLENAELDPLNESPDQLLKDLDELGKIAPKLSASNKLDIQNAVKEAKAILMKMLNSRP